ncbi:hypothetical protein EYF80_022957 [Liparis tanakae]|uniref:Uncharacterized protein n=1 Tax=Liparis tanakae TaxID=230148 RepID=A0A4Z2HM08_9TELE|nr:hypothetical protein EYF80_022957 [Liparis tanakae]
MFKRKKEGNRSCGVKAYRADAGSGVDHQVFRLLDRGGQLLDFALQLIRIIIQLQRTQGKQMFSGFGQDPVGHSGLFIKYTETTLSCFSLHHVMIPLKHPAAMVVACLTSSCFLLSTFLRTCLLQSSSTVSLCSSNTPASSSDRSASGFFRTRPTFGSQDRYRVKPEFTGRPQWRAANATPTS